MPTAALWICTGSAPWRLSPCLPNSHLTSILRSPRAWDCHLSLWIEKFACKLFLGIWCVSCMACSEAQWWEGHMCLWAGSSSCWDCFCLRPPLRAGTVLGAVRRFFCSLGWCYELGLRTRRKEQGLDRMWLREQLPMKKASSALSENRLPMRSELFTGLGRKFLSWHILR